MVLTYKNKTAGSLAFAPKNLKRNKGRFSIASTRHMEVKSMLAEGFTYREIADSLGIHIKSVMRLAAKSGVCSKNTGGTPKPEFKKGYYISYRKNNKKFEAISTRTGKNIYVGIYDTEKAAETAAILFNMKQIKYEKY